MSYVIGANQPQVAVPSNASIGTRGTVFQRNAVRIIRQANSSIAAALRPVKPLIDQLPKSAAWKNRLMVAPLNAIAGMFAPIQGTAEKIVRAANTLRRGSSVVTYPGMPSFDMNIDAPWSVVLPESTAKFMQTLRVAVTFMLLAAFDPVLFAAACLKAGFTLVKWPPQIPGFTPPKLTPPKLSLPPAPKLTPPKLSLPPAPSLPAPKMPDIGPIVRDWAAFLSTRVGAANFLLAGEIERSGDGGFKNAVDKIKSRAMSVAQSVSASSKAILDAIINDAEHIKAIASDLQGKKDNYRGPGRGTYLNVQAAGMWSPTIPGSSLMGFSGNYIGAVGDEGDVEPDAEQLAEGYEDQGEPDTSVDGETPEETKAADDAAGSGGGDDPESAGKTAAVVAPKAAPGIIKMLTDLFNLGHASGLDKAAVSQLPGQTKSQNGQTVLPDAAHGIPPISFSGMHHGMSTGAKVVVGIGVVGGVVGIGYWLSKR